MTNKTDKISNAIRAGAQLQSEQLPTDTNPRIYVACLASYNNGKLYGRWINADQEAEDIRAEMADMLKKSSEPFAEEWAIHDYEGFRGYRLSESEDIEEVAALAAQITEHGKPYLAALALSSNRAEADALMEEYCGEYNSDEAFTQQLLEECGQIPDELAWYIHIDWTATARDIMMDYIKHNGHYFRQC